MGSVHRHIPFGMLRSENAIVLPYYALIAAIVGIGGSAAVLNDPMRRRIVVATSLLAIGLFVGARDVGVGTDTIGYFFQYQSGYERTDEVGYSALSDVAAAIGLDFQGFLFLTSGIVIGAVSIAIYRYSQVPWQSFYLYITMGLFVMSLTGIRQSLAAAFVILAIVALLEGRGVMFLSLVLIAYAFHNSALLVLPLIALTHLKLSRRGGLIVLVVAAIVGTQSRLVASALRWMGWEKYEVYIEQGLAINPLVLAVSLFVPLACLALWPTEEPSNWRAKDEPRGRSAHSMLFLLAVLNFACVSLALNVPMMTRLTYYFTTFVAILIPNTISYWDSRPGRLLANAALILLPFTLFVLTVPDSSLGIAPYSPFYGGMR